MPDTGLDHAPLLSHRTTLAPGDCLAIWNARSEDIAFGIERASTVLFAHFKDHSASGVAFRHAAVDLHKKLGPAKLGCPTFDLLLRPRATPDHRISIELAIPRFGVRTLKFESDTL